MKSIVSEIKGLVGTDSLCIGHELGEFIIQQVRVALNVNELEVEAPALIGQLCEVFTEKPALTSVKLQVPVLLNYQSCFLLPLL